MYLLWWLNFPMLYPQVVTSFFSFDHSEFTSVLLNNTHTSKCIRRHNSLEIRVNILEGKNNLVKHRGQPANQAFKSIVVFE
jgi:hypothetical protein